MELWALRGQTGHPPSPPPMSEERCPVKGSCPPLLCLLS